MKSIFTSYAQLKAYWWNPDNHKVQVKLRDLRPRQDSGLTTSLLNRLKAAGAERPFTVEPKPLHTPEKPVSALLQRQAD